MTAVSGGEWSTLLFLWIYSSIMPCSLRCFCRSLLPDSLEWALTTPRGFLHRCEQSTVTTVSARCLMALCCCIRCGAVIEVEKYASAILVKNNYLFQILVLDVVTQTVVLNSVVKCIVLSYNSFCSCRSPSVIILNSWTCRSCWAFPWISMVANLCERFASSLLLQHIWTQWAQDKYFFKVRTFNTQ